MNKKVPDNNIQVYRDLKILLSLMIAAISMTLTGLLCSATPFNSSVFNLKVFVTITIIGFIYSFNDIIDNKNRISIKKYFFSLLPVLWLIIFMIGHRNLLKYIETPAFNIFIAYFILAVGITYSLEINFFSRTFKIKNFFIIKNLFIAFGWAALVLFGSQSPYGDREILIAIFAVIQIFIGSIIRDIDDIKDDEYNKVLTFPVKFGVSKTLFLLHIINFTSFLFIIISSFYYTTLIPTLSILIIPIFWRFMIINLFKKNYKKKTHLQIYNLATCVIIYLSQVILL